MIGEELEVTLVRHRDRERVLIQFFDRFDACAGRADSLFDLTPVAAERVLELDVTRRVGIGELDPQALNGSNDMQLGVFSNEEYGHVLLTAVFDNLGKGAAGAAVQNLDLMLGRY